MTRGQGRSSRPWCVLHGREHEFLGLHALLLVHGRHDRGLASEGEKPGVVGGFGRSLAGLQTVDNPVWSDDAQLSLPGVLKGLVVLHARGDGGDEMSHPVVEFPGHAAPIRDHVGPQGALIPFAQAGKAGGHPRKNLARAGVEPAVR